MDIKALVPEFKGKLKTVLIVGPPGSGKGTMAKFLSCYESFYHLSSGDVFRGIDKKSPLGDVCSKYTANGMLVPDDLTLAVFHRYVKGLIYTNRFKPETQLLLLDGLPRTKAQAELLDPFLDIQGVIVLETADLTVLAQRINKRSSEEMREDDKKEGLLARRMQLYESETLKMLVHYKKSLLIKVNAEQKPLEVLHDILFKLSKVC